MLRLVVSGGQTGADRGGLDFGIRAGIPHGGFCPLGRKAEDGQIPRDYRLIETDSYNYLLRTELNVLLAEATLLIYIEPMGPGSKRTCDFCIEHKRIILPIIFDPQKMDLYVAKLRKWLAENDIKVLNVAGSRESKANGIQAFTAYLLTKAVITA